LNLDAEEPERTGQRKVLPSRLWIISVQTTQSNDESIVSGNYSRNKDTECSLYQLLLTPA
jgi:hypothetical protein